MSTVIAKIQSKAEKLYELRRLIEQKEEEHKKSLEALKQERDATQAEVLEDMNKHGLSSLKVRSGDSFTRGVRRGIEIVSEVYALAWAKEHNAISINKTILQQQLAKLKEIPKCFAVVETEFISVRKAKKQEDGV